MGADGEVMVLDPSELDRPFRMSFSAHQLGITGALAAARPMGKAPDRVAAVGVAPFSLETAYGPSPGADDCFDAPVKAAAFMREAWGVEEAAGA